MQLNIDRRLNAKLDAFIARNVFKTKRNALELACAIGLVLNDKRDVREPVPVEVEHFDQWHVLSIIAMEKNAQLTTRDEVMRELEMYIAAGGELLRKKGKLDFYEIYERCMEYQEHKKSKLRFTIYNLHYPLYS